MTATDVASTGDAKGKKRRGASIGEPAVHVSYEVFYEVLKTQFQVQTAANQEVLTYTPERLDDFVRGVNQAPPMQLLETERAGVDAAFLGDLAKRMDVSYSHLAEVVGIPKATAARKLSNNEKVNGAAAIALARLLALAGEIVEDSTAPQAASFDTAKWLGQWIERPQPALGGHKPSELLDTPTGVAMVIKLLGAIRSGAYQ